MRLSFCVRDRNGRFVIRVKVTLNRNKYGKCIGGKIVFIFYYYIFQKLFFNVNYCKEYYKVNSIFLLENVYRSCFFDLKNLEIL